MGFFDIVKEGFEKKMNNIAAARERGNSMSDDELKRRFKNASGDAKWGYAAALKDRGYGRKDNDD